MLGGPPGDTAPGQQQGSGPGGAGGGDETPTTRGGQRAGRTVCPLLGLLRSLTGRLGEGGREGGLNHRLDIDLGGLERRLGDLLIRSCHRCGRLDGIRLGHGRGLRRGRLRGGGTLRRDRGRHGAGVRAPWRPFSGLINRGLSSRIPSGQILRRVVGGESLGRGGGLVDDAHRRRSRHRLGGRRFSGDRIRLDDGVTRPRIGDVIRRRDGRGRIVAGRLCAAIHSGLARSALLRGGLGLVPLLLTGLPGDLAAVVRPLGRRVFGVVKVDGRSVVRADGLGGSGLRSGLCLGLLCVGVLSLFGGFNGRDGLDGVGGGL